MVTRHTQEAAITNTADELRTSLRDIVVQHVRETPSAVTQLADGLHMPESSVEKMLSAESWDLGVAITTADILGLDVRVTTG